jgi:hypothetical protein
VLARLPARYACRHLVRATSSRSRIPHRARDASCRAHTGNVIVTGDCPSCGHEWDGHPVAVLSSSACVVCVYEEDHGVRTTICELVSPELADKRASAFLSASAIRKIWGVWQLHVVDASGKLQLFGPDHFGRPDSTRAQATTREATDALQRLTVPEFRDWLRRHG